MSARLKLKRIQATMNGVMKMAQKALYERDEIHRRFIANTVTIGIETSIDDIALFRDTGHYIEHVTNVDDGVGWRGRLQVQAVPAYAEERWITGNR